MVNLTWKLIA